MNSDLQIQYGRFDKFGNELPLNGADDFRKKLFKILQHPHRCYVTTPKEHLIYATIFTPVEVLSIECTAETLIRLCSFELEDQGICQKWKEKG